MTIEGLERTPPDLEPQKPGLGLAFYVKWVASIIQIFGYALTAFAVVPLNLYLFLVGVMGWFVVGVLWNDRAIMLIHIVAFGAMIVGMAST